MAPNSLDDHFRVHTSLEANHIIGDKHVRVMIKKKVRETICIFSHIEPKATREALKDEEWRHALEEETDQIIKNNTWTLVSQPYKKIDIGIKWVFRNKVNENGDVIKNKAKLVCKGYEKKRA